MAGDRAEGHQRSHFGVQVAAELPGLYRYARSITARDEDAEDLVGETVVRTSHTVPTEAKRHFELGCTTSSAT